MRCGWRIITKKENRTIQQYFYFRDRRVVIIELPMYYTAMAKQIHSRNYDMKAHKSQDKNCKQTSRTLEFISLESQV